MELLKYAAISLGAAVFIIILIINIPKIKRKQKNGESIRNEILVNVLVPVLIMLLQPVINYEFESFKSEAWSTYITATDEAIMQHNGYMELNNYYARINETDEKLDTGILSAHFQRIDTTDKTKPARYKYRYIEIINKDNDTAPLFIKLLECSDQCIMRLENTGRYFDSASFYTKNDDKAVTYYYYTEENDKWETSQQPEDDLEKTELSEVCEQVYVTKIIGEKNKVYSIHIASDVKLPETLLEGGWSREFEGMRNFESPLYNGEKKHMYCYIQKGNGSDSDRDEITVLDKASTPKGLLRKDIDKVILCSFVPKSKGKNIYNYLNLWYISQKNYFRPIYAFEVVKK